MTFLPEWVPHRRDDDETTTPETHSGFRGESSFNATPPRLADGDTNQVDQFFVLKLTDTLHEVGELGTPLLSEALDTHGGAWSIEEIKLCLGAGWHGNNVVRGPGANKADI